MGNKWSVLSKSEEHLIWKLKSHGLWDLNTGLYHFGNIYISGAAGGSKAWPTRGKWRSHPPRVETGVGLCWGNYFHGGIGGRGDILSTATMPRKYLTAPKDCVHAAYSITVSVTGNGCPACEASFRRTARMKSLLIQRTERRSQQEQSEAQKNIVGHPMRPWSITTRLDSVLPLGLVFQRNGEWGWRLVQLSLT